MGKNMKTSAADYAKVLEGLGYAHAIIKRDKARIDEIISALNVEGVLGGQDGHDWVVKLNSIQAMIEELSSKFTKVADKVTEVCSTNGVQVTGSMNEDIDAVRAKMGVLAGEVNSALKK